MREIREVCDRLETDTKAVVPLRIYKRVEKRYKVVNIVQLACQLGPHTEKLGIGTVKADPPGKMDRGSQGPPPSV